MKQGNRKINGYYIAIFVAIVFSWWGLLDTKASDYISSSLVQALSAFGLAKLFNATVSVLQSIQISVFVSSVTIGELLAPFNDMVQDFSGVMKVAVSSLIFQSLLLKIISTVYFKSFVTVSGLLFGYLYWMRSRFAEVAYKVFVTSLGAKFLLVLVVLLSALVDMTYLNAEKTQTMEKIQSHSQDVNQVSSGLGVAADLKQSLREDKQALLVKQHTQQAIISAASKRLQKLKAQNNKLEQQIASRKKQLSTFDALFSQDALLSTLQAKLEALTKERIQVQKKRAAARVQVKALAESIEHVEQGISPEDNGFFARIKASSLDLSHYKKAISHYVTTLNGLVNDFLTLLALFAFNTVFIPVLFLFLGAKGFKLVWKIKPSGLIERVKQSAKAVS